MTRDGMSSMVVSNKGTMKSIHDQLVEAWELADRTSFAESIANLEEEIGSQPRLNWGGKRGAMKVYER